MTWPKISNLKEQPLQHSAGIRDLIHESARDAAWRTGMAAADQTRPDATLEPFPIGPPLPRTTLSGHEKLPMEKLSADCAPSGLQRFFTDNTIALLNSSTKAGNLCRGVVFPPLVWLAFEDVSYAIHGLAAQIAFALHSSTNLALALCGIPYAHSTLSWD
jgi:hypothetical protein